MNKRIGPSCSVSSEIIHHRTSDTDPDSASRLRSDAVTSVTSDLEAVTSDLEAVTSVTSDLEAVQLALAPGQAALQGLQLLHQALPLLAAQLHLLLAPLLLRLTEETHRRSALLQEEPPHPQTDGQKEEEDLYGRTDRPTFSRAFRSEAFSLPSRVTLRSSSSLSCCSCWAEPWASSPASFCRFSAWGTVGTPSTSTMTGRSDRF